MESEPRPQSLRLGYRRPVASDVDALHAIITDDHVKRYLCDGQTLPREWAVDRASIRVLEKLGFERCGEQPGAFGAMILFRLPG